MNSNQIVDVVVPNYNKAKFIEDCFLSLLSQSFKNWRCIVIDGFSDDGSWEIIQRFARQESRFEIYQTPRNGLYNSWNFGLSKVANPYFCILTSDDTWDKNWLQLAFSSLEDDPKAVCAVARTQIIDANGENLDIAIHNLIGEQLLITDTAKPKVINGIISSMANYFLGSIYTSIHSLLIRSEVLVKGERFTEDVGAIADYEWYVRIGFYGDIIYHPYIKANHRCYEGQATTKKRQAENGIFMQKIHSRNCKPIADKLGAVGKEFAILAHKYDREILAYRYARPTLSELKSQPITTIAELINVLLKMPRQTIADTYLKVMKRNFYIESSLNNAKRIYTQLIDS